MISLDQPQHIGVLGGTFDPVHNGHLHIANELRTALGLERVIWVPAGRPPHKCEQIVSRDRDRIAMLELALADSLYDEISAIDIDRAGPSFTADTLELLSEQLAPVKLYFLMGEDSLRDLPKWYDPERILHFAELAVVGRPGVEADINAVARAVPGLQDRVFLAPTQEIPVSSSDIRRRVREDRPIHGLVPADVAAYIFDHGLYKSRTA